MHDDDYNVAKLKFFTFNFNSEMILTTVTCYELFQFQQQCNGCLLSLSDACKSN